MKSEGSVAKSSLNSIWDGVPRPEPLIQAVKNAASKDLLTRQKGLSGLRGAIKVMETIPARAKCVRFLRHVVRKFTNEAT